MIKVFTTKNFNTELSRVLKSGNAAKANMQAAIMFALNYFADTNNPLYLSVLLQRTADTCDGRVIVDYILKHANVHKASDKNDKPIFKMHGKATCADVVIPEATWFAPKAKVEKAKVTIDLDKELDAALLRLSKKSPELEIAAMLLSTYAHSNAFKTALAAEWNRRQDAIAASKDAAEALAGTPEANVA